MRVLRGSLWGVGAGLVGWTVGSLSSSYGLNNLLNGESSLKVRSGSQTNPESDLYNDPKVAEVLSQLRKKGYIEELEKPVSHLLAIHQQYMFTQSVLTGPKRLSKPIKLRNPRNGAYAAVFRLGSELQTKQGFTAAVTTIFDETLAMAAFPKLPNKIGVTGTLELGPIRAPPSEDGLVVLFSKATTSQGRRSASEGELVAVSTGTSLARARTVMVEPWWGGYLAYIASLW